MVSVRIENNQNVTVHLDEIKSNLLVIGTNSQVTLLGEITQDRGIEVVVGEHSELKSYIIQKNGSFDQRNIAKTNAKIYSYVFYFGQGKINLQNILEGDRSEAYDTEVFAIKDESTLLVDTTLFHKGKNTSGNILVKGTVKDTALAKVNGMIKIGKEGAGANSFLTEHVMLLNPGARADTNPQLEIENNDVSSRHAATVTPIDENKLFYMMARGVKREDARRLITEGFLNVALQGIENGHVRSQVSELIEKAI